MKKLFILAPFLIAVYGCPVYDPPSGHIDIRNYSDKPIYVYDSWNDSLALFPSLRLFEYYSSKDTTKEYNGWRSEDTIYYSANRIDAYAMGSVNIGGTRRNPGFYIDTLTLTLFFITEETMRNHSWKEIWREQMYVKRVSFSENDMKERRWKYTYYP